MRSGYMTACRLCVRAGASRACAAPQGSRFALQPHCPAVHVSKPTPIKATTTSRPQPPSTSRLTRAGCRRLALPPACGCAREGRRLHSGRRRLLVRGGCVVIQRRGVVLCIRLIHATRSRRCSRAPGRRHGGGRCRCCCCAPGRRLWRGGGGGGGGGGSSGGCRGATGGLGPLHRQRQLALVICGVACEDGRVAGGATVVSGCGGAGAVGWLWHSHSAHNRSQATDRQAPVSSPSSSSGGSLSLVSPSSSGVPAEAGAAAGAARAAGRAAAEEGREAGLAAEDGREAGLAAAAAAGLAGEPAGLPAGLAAATAALDAAAGPSPSVSALPTNEL